MASIIILLSFRCSHVSHYFIYAICFFIVFEHSHTYMYQLDKKEKSNKLYSQQINRNQPICYTLQDTINK